MTNHFEKVQHIVETVPDSVKVVAAGAAPMASLFGLTAEEWSFVLSSIVAILFIVEKLYKFYRAVKNGREEGIDSE